MLRAPQLVSTSAPRQPPTWLPRQLPEAPRIPSTPTPTPSLLTQSNLPPKLQAQHNPPTVWFSPNFPLQSDLSNPVGTSPDKSPDDRKVRLGKTIRILQSQLPTLLQSPLPQEVLSPNITLHLFPSTHPHLPAVTGRVAYIAALWSSPIAWNRIPLIGNVRLEILSERMVAQPLRQRPSSACGEQLVVRWRTSGGKGKIGAWLNSLNLNGGSGKDTAATTAPVGDALPAGDKAKEFTGLFLFDFDAEGRILSHTIEHVQEGGQWEKGVGAKVVGLTDWLLGGMKGTEGGACPAFSRKRR
ncbi:hypothetical protein B0T14DRAFT_425020 [Immersiella caudata]|uniref:Chromosome transmission fidelity protein 4 n=1 Tax=Immersiella caudata TaxID=314043 RepID=A0AA39X2Q0_9PEZI|nr:hypothetical protein B0T14DRAFT_425020 [Immersiella caudata]